MSDTLVAPPSIMFLALACAAILSFCLIAAIRPILRRHALAKPNSRSSHTIPTPQGGGAAVVAAALIIAALAMTAVGLEIGPPVISVFSATLFIAVIGAVDDYRPIPVLPRLVSQALAVGIIIISIPTAIQIIPHCPFWLERGLLLIAGIWFVNLVNFMDGLDWMTVAETIPITGALAMFGITGHLPSATAMVMSSLGGAMIGFAPFNKPVAKLFLGDVGSLPIGLLLGWGLLELAAQGHVATAVLLPLYYLADATVTILRRAFNRERIWVAHRTHFYQRATDNGLTVMQVVATVLALNVVLAALAAATLLWTAPSAQFTLLGCGVIAVAAVLFHFSRSREIATKRRQSIS